jgi:voltage-gated potassium channel Kch
MVLESGHTLILGWSDRVPAVVSELIIANRSRDHAAIVILAEVDKTLMEDTLRDLIDDWGPTRLVCRSGNTSAFADLAMVNLEGARSIIVIGGNDAAVIKSLLAIRHAGESATVAAVIAEVYVQDAAESIRALFGDRVVIVNSDAVVAELTAQACRQRGLSQVFHELLDFDGDEIYFDSFPVLAGRSYLDAQLAFETSTVMGIRKADGALKLNPVPTTLVEQGDQLIAIASDDSTFVCGAVRSPANRLAVPELRDSPPVERRIVLVGWSALGPRVVAELDDFLGSETTLEIIVDPVTADVDALRRSVVAQNLRVEISAHAGRPEEIARHVADRAFDEVIVLGRREGVTAEEADALTLLTLLAFNQLVKTERLDRVRVVAEMLQQRHAPLAQATGADDFIVSDELTSLMIAQLSENHELDRVFRDLFDQRSCTIEMVPAGRYDAARAGSFAEIVVAASSLGHSALGFRRHRDGAVVLNPAKSEALSLTADDSIVVLR